VDAAIAVRLKARVFDAQGRAVVTLDRRIDPGKNRIAVDVRHLVAGAYFLYVAADRYIKTSRFVVLH
jgi:hypothetical protein